MKDEVAAAAKAAPAIGGAAMVSNEPATGMIAGLSLNDWVLVATFVYVALQIGLLLPKYWAILRRRFAPRGAGE
jgi:hypothetical protein